MGLSKEEFKVLVMLYVANSNGRVSFEIIRGGNRWEAVAVGGLYAERGCGE